MSPNPGIIDACDLYKTIHLGVRALAQLSMSMTWTNSLGTFKNALLLRRMPVFFSQPHAVVHFNVSRITSLDSDHSHAMIHRPANGVPDAAFKGGWVPSNTYPQKMS